MQKTLRRTQNSGVWIMGKYLIVMSLLVASSVVAQDEPYSPFSGDYKVNEIRGMWMTCNNSIRTQSPKNYPYGWKVCDCFVDRMSINSHLNSSRVALRR